MVTYINSSTFLPGFTILVGALFTVDVLSIFEPEMYRVKRTKSEIKVDKIPTAAAVSASRFIIVPAIPVGLIAKSVKHLIKDRLNEQTKADLSIGSVVVINALFLLYPRDNALCS